MKFIRLVLALAAMTLSLPGVHAGVITVGTQSAGPSGENCIPFGCPSLSGARYQQVYSNTAFPGTIGIEAITFFNSNTNFPPEGTNVTAGIYSFHFSTTSKAVGGLNVVNLNDNVGPDSQLFFTGALGGPAGTEFTVTGTTPFFYDPTLGNLLLEIGISSPGPNTSVFFDMDNSALISRAFVGVPPEGNGGLVTRFQTVPVPGTLALLCFGLAALGMRHHRVGREEPRKTG